MFPIQRPGYCVGKQKGPVQVGGMTSRTIREMVVPPLRNAGAGLPLSVLVEVDGLMLLIVSPRTS